MIENLAIILNFCFQIKNLLFISKMLIFISKKN